ncbi:transposase [Thermosynechococcus sp. HN-54]|nr:transposase [Thermosynechococcus sp. HN-54]URR34692.1 transposase [Thermosynechococcus sp. HN-54]URR34826.1 transposase [Thermosynechococcus sp. HN-54]URR34891.1 transposase [Thermosynechococcus sp. HN-54]URR35004.1 transposase [Thermosynechococcus sp. HN-54]URR35061.1 transposase [Thermosynechococcus sp. HN-54]
MSYSSLKRRKINQLTMASFSVLVKSILKQLSPCDYPVLNSQLFFKIWLTYILDQGLTSMRALFYRLNHSGITVDMSTFSKANKTRTTTLFERIYTHLMSQARKRHRCSSLMLFPIDSTVITLTSKLFWFYKYHQVKLITGFDLTENILGKAVVSFGERHDLSFQDEILEMIPENAVAIMDRGFASWRFLERLSERKCLFVVRIKNNMRMKLNHERYRVVQFFDEHGTEFRIATNLMHLSDEEVSELYRHRWGIENLWKFLKMHLSLDKLITKSLNGVINQIYMVLIGYLILELMEIPEYFGRKLLDKLRYLQLELSRRCSIVHWSFDWQPELLVT